MDEIKDYFKDNFDSIITLINETFDQSKEFFKIQILKKIREWLKNKNIHYEWEYDGCPYDFSGILIEKGTINLNQTLSVFLENEYTGDSLATYTSHYGFYYTTYEYKLEFLTLDMAYTILNNVIRNIVKKNFGIDITDDMIIDDLDDIRDELYSESRADFFAFHNEVVDYLGIADIELNQILNI